VPGPSWFPLYYKENHFGYVSGEKTKGPLLIDNSDFPCDCSVNAEYADLAR
jgi:hypothetical protein